MRARPGGLALGCVRGRGLDISLVAGFYGSPRQEKRIWSWRGGEAFLGGAEGVEEAWGEVDFAGEEAARGLLATAVEIGHGEVLLELVHNNKI